jgi:hypothetical protein
MKEKIMFTIKKNKIFEAQSSFTRVRVRDIKADRKNPKFNRVTIVDINSKNRPIKGTERTVYQDSIRRRYAAA